MHSQFFVRLSLLFIPLAYAVSRVYSALHRAFLTKMQNLGHVSLIWFQLDSIKDTH